MNRLQGRYDSSFGGRFTGTALAPAGTGRLFLDTEILGHLTFISIQVSLVPKAVIFLRLAHNQVVDHLHVHHIGGMDQSSGQPEIVGRGLGAAGGMVVGKNQSGSSARTRARSIISLE